MSLANIGADVTLIYAPRAVTVDVSSADFDCTTAFPTGYATEIWVGTSAPGNLAVVHMGDSTAVTYKNIPQGSILKGCFKTIKHTNTTVSDLVARGS